MIDLESCLLIATYRKQENILTVIPIPIKIDVSPPSSLFEARPTVSRDSSVVFNTAELVVSHMVQLHGVVNRGMDVIYVLQDGWIGSWGEWHGSKTGIENNKTAAQVPVLERPLIQCKAF